MTKLAYLMQFKRMLVLSGGLGGWALLPPLSTPSSTEQLCTVYGERSSAKSDRPISHTSDRHVSSKKDGDKRALLVLWSLSMLGPLNGNFFSRFSSEWTTSQ